MGGSVIMGWAACRARALAQLSTATGTQAFHSHRTFDKSSVCVKHTRSYSTFFFFIQ